MAEKIDSQNHLITSSKDTGVLGLVKYKSHKCGYLKSKNNLLLL